MFWVILFLIIIIASFVLAVKSMRDFEPAASVKSLHSTLFFIRNKHAFSAETLFKLYSFSLQSKFTFTLEKLFKGDESAFVLYAPADIEVLLPELNLLQIEDYLPPLEHTFVWEIAPKEKIGKELVVGVGFLKDIHLDEDQKFFWQIALYPQKDNKFQATLRVMVNATGQTQRIGLAKLIDQHILNSTGLIKKGRETDNAAYYDAFSKRLVIKKEVENSGLSFKEIFALLG